MSVRSLAVTHLEQMHQRLQQLASHLYFEADQHALREILTDTITELQAIYPDDLTYPSGCNCFII